MTMKIVIVFDTNNIRYELPDDLYRMFNGDTESIKQFFMEHKIVDVKMAIPEMVVDEIYFQRLRTIDGTIEKMDKITKGLRTIPATKILKERDHLKMLKKNYSEHVSKYKVDLIKNVKVPSQVLLNRSLKKIPPFREGDNGFKDTNIWLSLLEYAKKHKKAEYILFTADRGFAKSACMEEFAQTTGSRVSVLKNVDEIKEYLDKKLKLDLKLKKLHDQMSNEIKEKSGTILTILKKHFSNERGGFSYDQFGYYGMMGIGSAGESENIDEYNLTGLRVNNISKKEKKEVYIVDLEADIEESKQVESPSIHASTAQVGAFRTRKQINFQIEYNSSDKEIDLMFAAFRNEPYAQAAWSPGWPPYSRPGE